MKGGGEHRCLPNQAATTNAREVKLTFQHWRSRLSEHWINILDIPHGTYDSTDWSLSLSTQWDGRTQLTAFEVQRNCVKQPSTEFWVRIEGKCSYFGGDMIWYRFFKTTAVAWQIYVQFAFLSHGSLKMVKISTHQISWKSDRLWRRYDVISIFSRWRPPSALYVTWGDGGPTTMLGKLQIHRINRFGDMAFDKSWRFGLKLLMRPFWGSLWGIFSQFTSPIVLTPKRTILLRKHV